MKGIIRNLHWQSDWNGDEVSYPEILVVGLYTSHELGCDFYINTETGDVLEVMARCADCYDA